MSFCTQEYWQGRYTSGGNSGPGSYEWALLRVVPKPAPRDDLQTFYVFGR